MIISFLFFQLSKTVFRRVLLILLLAVVRQSHGFDLDTFLIDRMQVSGAIRQLDPEESKEEFGNLILIKIKNDQSSTRIYRKLLSYLKSSSFDTIADSSPDYRRIMRANDCLLEAWQDEENLKKVAGTGVKYPGFKFVNSYKLALLQGIAYSALGSSTRNLNLLEEVAEDELSPENLNSLLKNPVLGSCARSMKKAMINRRKIHKEVREHFLIDLKVFHKTWEIYPSSSKTKSYLLEFRARKLVKELLNVSKVNYCSWLFRKDLRITLALIGLKEPSLKPVLESDPGADYILIKREYLQRIR